MVKNVFYGVLFSIYYVNAENDISYEKISGANLNIVVSKNEIHISDFFFKEKLIGFGEESFFLLKSEMISFRMVKDKDSYQFSITEPILAFTAFSVSIANQSLFEKNEPVFIVSNILNPTIEYYFFGKKFPISMAAGYYFDFFWFCTNPAVFFEPHLDLGTEFKLGIKWKITASVGYLVHDVYDLKGGWRFNLGLGVW
ncbi:hypothetical protein [Fibrobacter sp.]|uniref:hypothetical protein n=1 Tax=Fibrobacter sp. TaxID=35828 RepID=UPI002605A1AE|nr:hypothetical protein [Fibrobacter sp.]MDD7496819.1 hypothetical protein [Fibrobacter sp.]MDY5724528.1 hypothetical protein [Fibrobacter sp.]